MGLVNRTVVGILDSPLRRVLCRSTCVLLYVGTRTGQTRVLPVQYALDGDDVVVASARADGRSWWRNFRDGHEVEVLLDGAWTSFTMRLLHGDDAADARHVYERRFPKAAVHLDDAAMLRARRQPG